MSEYTFEAMRREFVTGLWDYGWADHCVYRVAELQPGYDATLLFTAFMADRVFRDSYITKDSWKHDTKETHGPFVIAHLRPELFKPVSFTELESDIERVLEDPEFTEPPDPAQQSALAEFVSRFREEGFDRFLLDVDLGDSGVRHEIAWILHVFREFVFVDAEAGEMHQVVLGFD